MISAVSETGGDRGRLTAALRDLGVPEETIRRAVERGDPEGAILEAVLLPGRAERTVTLAQVEAEGGLSATEIAELLQAMGFPRPGPDEPALTPEEAKVFVELGDLREVWPYELSRQLARVYGRLLARIARTGAQFLELHTGPRLRAASDSRTEQLRAMREAFARLLYLPDPLLAGVHRRWLEYELAQRAFGEAESRAPDLRLPGAVELTLLFCDLKDFTAYATAEGDVSAVEAIDVFARTVDAERGEGGRVVKALGDGHMLSYADTAEAVSAGARIVDRMGADELLAVHASVHRGTVIAREGDYFGGAVNLAARLLSVAGRHELVATASVVEACPSGPFDWEPLGARRIRGVDQNVEVFKLR